MLFFCDFVCFFLVYVCVRLCGFVCVCVCLCVFCVYFVCISLTEMVIVSTRKTYRIYTRTTASVLTSDMMLLEYDCFIGSKKFLVF